MCEREKERGERKGGDIEERRGEKREKEKEREKSTFQELIHKAMVSLKAGGMLQRSQAEV